MNEAMLQKGVLDCARVFGWTVAHFRPAQTSQGWRTPVAADGKGFPDLVLVRERVLFRELKGNRGRIRPEQAVWLAVLRDAGADVAVWTPDDWTSGRIEEELRRWPT